MEKYCNKCKQTKSVELFSRRKEKWQPWCKECQKQAKNKWIENNRDKVKWNRIWTRFRLRQEDYYRILEDQNDECAICGTSFLDTKPNIDHNHSTGKVRGLLCTDCNLAVGWYEKHEVNLDKFAEYLAPVD